MEALKHQDSYGWRSMVSNILTAGFWSWQHQHLWRESFKHQWWCNRWGRACVGSWKCISYIHHMFYILQHYIRLYDISYSASLRLSLYNNIFFIYHEISSYGGITMLVVQVYCLRLRASAIRHVLCHVFVTGSANGPTYAVTSKVLEAESFACYFCWWLKSGDHQLRLVGEIPLISINYLQSFIHPWWLFGISSINSCRCI